MGSPELDGYVSHADAAKLLEVSSSTLYRLVDRGLFVQLRHAGKRYYKKVELQFYKANADETPDLREVRSLALQALSTARRTEQRLFEVLERMGFDVEPLQRDESSVRTFYKEAEQELESDLLPDGTWVRYWSGCLFGMDEVYLSLVMNLIGTDEPWKVYFDASTKLIDKLRARHDEGLTLSIKRLESAQSHLRYIGYMFCRRMHGPKIANHVFGGRASAVDELSAILFD